MNTSASQLLGLWLQKMPLVAILRGLTPAEAPEIGHALTGSGFGLIEVPLNSPDPMQSISLLRQSCPHSLIGAGTVLSASQVHEVHNAGGQMIVSPNFNPAVAEVALSLDMAYLPGVATPTEAFAALAAGAHGLKLFPAEMLSPAVVKALRAVLPANTPLLPVGGITPSNMAAYLKAGAHGFGIGSALYAPGKSAQAVSASAQGFVAAHADSMRP
jgi:2-dehydro-3-deoxyphosphogalactonate aldolase